MYDIPSQRGKESSTMINAKQTSESKDKNVVEILYTQN